MPLILNRSLLPGSVLLHWVGGLINDYFFDMLLSFMPFWLLNWGMAFGQGISSTYFVSMNGVCLTAFFFFIMNCPWLFCVNDTSLWCCCAPRAVARLIWARGLAYPEGGICFLPGSMRAPCGFPASHP